jgi:hypothetical protein
MAVAESKGTPAMNELQGARSRNGSDTTAIPLRKTYLQTLSVKGRVDHTVSFCMTILRSFTYFLVPQVLWVITTFGIVIGLGSIVINFTFLILIVAPPYNWNIVSSIPNLENDKLRTMRNAHPALPPV